MSSYLRYGFVVGCCSARKDAAFGSCLSPLILVPPGSSPSEAAGIPSWTTALSASKHLEGQWPVIMGYFVSIMGYFGVQWPVILLPGVPGRVQI